MKSDEAAKLLADTLPRPFSATSFTQLAANLVKSLDTSKRGAEQIGKDVYEPFRDHIHSFQRLGQYTDPDGQVLDVLAVQVKDARKLDRARTALRNFGVEYLKRKDEYDRESLLLAYYAEGEPMWRLSYLHVGFEVVEEKGKVKTKQVKSPARRLSYLVGEGEPSHTAATQLHELLRRNERPTVAELEKGFAIEKVSEDFFQQYKTLFANLLDHLNAQLKKDKALKLEFDNKGIEPVGFAKKLLGQLVFLYFLQKKGWLGVHKTANWGAGNRNFLRSRWQLAKTSKESFFDDQLKYLFYEALADPRKKQADPSYYKRFDCRIPFLNGGLFEPERGYDWQNVALNLPNTLFSNADKLGDDTGTGILDVFDRFNFTVKEDEPLEREVAVDPEMLGKVFERLLEVKDRKSKGAFYTPREIVHYLCQQSLALYLDGQLNDPGAAPTAALGTKPPQLFSHQQTQTRGQLPLEAAAPAGGRVALPDLETFLRHSTLYVHGQRVTVADAVEIPATIKQCAADLDKHLADIRVLDPAIGSGAFPVGMLHEIVQARLALSHYLPAAKQADRTPYRLKRACIQKSIYGVDIDASAIEIAKLRLWLSLVVDEDDVRQIEPLPNLEYNLVAGNSLNLPSKQVSFNDEFDSQELEALHAEAFDETNPAKKNKLRAKIDKIMQRMTQGEFDFKVHFGEVMRHGRKGFDVVIGNPPYGGEKISPELKAAFALGKDDVYGAFLARFLGNRYPSPLVKGGLLSFIVSDTFMTIKSHLQLREQLVQQQLLKFIRVSRDTFDAMVNTVMVMAQNKPASNGHCLVMGDLTNVSARINHRKFLEFLEFATTNKQEAFSISCAEYAFYKYPQSIIKDCLKKPFFVANPGLLVFAREKAKNSKSSNTSFHKIPVTYHEVERNGLTIKLLPMSELSEVNQGISTGQNDYYIRRDEKGEGYEQVEPEKIISLDDIKTFTADEKLNGISPKDYDGKFYIPFDKGSESNADMGWMPNYYVPTRYFINWSKKSVSRMRNLTIEKRKIEAGEKEKIKPGDNRKIAAALRNPDKWFRPAICFSPTGEYSPSFRLGTSTVSQNTSSTIVVSKDSINIFVLGFLGSKLGRFLFKNYYNHTVHTQEGDVVDFIVPILKDESRIIRLVEDIIRKQKKNSSYDYASNEQLEIDKIVYESYGLKQSDIIEVEHWYARRYPKLAAAQLENLRKAGKTKEYEYFRALWQSAADSTPAA